MSNTTSSLKSRKCVLSDKISLDDTKWEFDVPELALPLANAAGLIVLVSLATSAMRHRIILRYDPVEMNRAIREPPLDQFILVSFADFRSVRASAQTAQGSIEAVKQPSTGRECTEYATKLLRSGISINGRHYNFYGHSNSQLKSRTCYFRAAPRDTIARQIESLGDFSKLKTVAKKAKRIGLLFSTAQVVMTVDPKRVEDISDITTGDYTFTDGCGLIAPKFAQDLARRARIVFRNQRYTPSVMQIRYRGYKGVVTLDPTMAKEGPWLRMRKSMKKFNGGDDLSFAVVESSKPYSFGYLNDEIVVLLDALGIERNILVQKQKEHFSFIMSALKDCRAAFRFLSYINRPKLAEQVILESLEAVEPKVKRLINGEISKMLNKREEQKCRILIPKSRLLFGICDAWGVLKEGQCAVKVTTDDYGHPQALTGTKVLVTRNPCLHPGDLQKFDVVAPQELSHLVDCIVFSSTGRRPAADLMSGGDLDGDTFFVTWDPDIIPTTLAQPAHYPGVREPLRFSPITEDDRLVHFAGYSNASLGRVKNLYIQWARGKGAMSSECQELNRLFSQCVDGNVIHDKQLEKFKNPPVSDPDTPPFVLDELHVLAKDLVCSIKDMSVDELETSSLDEIEQLVSQGNLAMSDFKLVQLGAAWCRLRRVPLQSILHVFDMDALTPEEKSWVMAQIPPSLEYPKLVFNALCSSQLVNQSDLDDFGLSRQMIHWKRIYTSEQDRLATFMDAASHNLELFHKTLILFRPNERLTLAIYTPQKITKADDFLVDHRVRLLAFPHTQGTETRSGLCLPTKKGYRLYCDGDCLQLFQNHRRNTWVFIQRAQSDERSYENLTRPQDRRRARAKTLEAGVNHDFRVSVALDKFGQGLQRHMGDLRRQGIIEAEIYIISNRDTRSRHALDLWEDVVGTDKELPLFERDPREYDVPLLKQVEWSLQDPLVVEIAHLGNYAALQRDIPLTELRKLIRWLLEHCQTAMVIRCYEELMAKIQSGGDVSASGGILEVLLELLPETPYSSVAFTKLQDWSVLPEEVRIALQNSGPVLLRSIILAESEYGQLIVRPFQIILDNLAHLSLDSFANLVETIALTVHNTDVALDLLLGCLDRSCDRLLIERPLIVKWFVTNITAVALEHIGEVQENAVTRDEMLSICQDENGDKTSRSENTDILVSLRIDAHGMVPKTNTHVRLIAASAPKSDVLERTQKMDGLVLESRGSVLKIRCFHPLPSFYKECSWKLQNCGLFVTTKTMMEAVRKFAIELDVRCGVADQILGTGSTNSSLPDSTWPVTLQETELHGSLNESQRAAVEAARNSKLLCLWGPPGTGKTQTIIATIRQLQLGTQPRILVTAPTHNAVDNVMRRYLSQLGSERNLGNLPLSPLRVSTEIRKVAEDLREYTCDALVGQEIYLSQKAMREAKKRVKEAQIIFTTCMGAGLGVLRGQTFDVVIIDEASQLTEPAALVPLVTGCSKAILVGDHVQLRPSVQNIALAVNFDVSLFERLYTRSGQTPGMNRVMLNQQYRMHSSICTFASRQFYLGKLLSGVQDRDRSLPNSLFPWPEVHIESVPCEQKDPRIVFLEYAGPEDLGNKSKSNRFQAELCVSICSLLRIKQPRSDTKRDGTSIAVLTPYTRQRQLLEKLLKDDSEVEVSSIDGFQGREADIVVFVTVRCNESKEIGFLKDLRRLNVAITRARLGLVIIGNRGTLGGGSAEDESTGVWKKLLQYTAVVRQPENLVETN